MTTKETVLEQTATAVDFAKELCALAREHLIGLITEEKESEFVFSMPGQVKVFRVCVREENVAQNLEKSAKK